ncbi:MAG: ASCH domain-containing protein [Chloroflexota bacterium]
MTKPLIDTYWQTYLATLPANSSIHTETYVAERFGDTPELADQLGQLIVAGIKTATCSALWEWEAEQSPLPAIGSKTILLDGQGQPLCIIEVTEVTINAYDQVDAQFASDEGEGDRSLGYWRQAHWEFFGRTLPNIGKTPTMDMPLVCERFQLVYK